MKEQKGIFKDVNPELLKFIRKHSLRMCPNGIYDNRMICSQVEFIRLINSLIEENKHLRNYADHSRFCSSKNTTDGICDCGYIKNNKP